MKNILITASCFFVLCSMKCNKGGNIAGRYDFEFVKLEAIVNDSSETIKLGDTLKFTLRIPNTLNGSTATTAVKSVEKGFYTAAFHKLDTVTKIGNRIRGAAITVSPGKSDEFGGIYVTTSGKPNISTLNIVPTSKGIYYVQAIPQPGTISVNNGYNIGLRVNFAVKDKHWIMFNSYQKDPNFFVQVKQLDDDGYAYYCFRVN